MLQRFNYLAGIFATAMLAAPERAPEFNYPVNYLVAGNSAAVGAAFNQGTLVGNGVTFTETRSTTGTFLDWQGVLRTAQVNEARFPALKRVANLFAAPTSTLGTQTVTVPAGQYQCQFTGTGTITFTGVFSGSLVGQGTNTIVAFNTPITCTAGGLICTVSGSVTLAMLENVTGQTNQNPANYKDAAVSYGAGVNGVDYTELYQNGNTVSGNVVTLARGAALTNATPNPPALLVEPSAATNLALQSRDLTQTAWVKVNVTAALDQVGLDGGANSASSLVSTLANGTALQTITLSSAQRTFSVYVKRITGTGAISISQDGVTWTAITGLINSSTYTQVTLTATQLNPVIGFQIAANGDKIAVDYNQLEAGVNASSAIPTTSAAVTRTADAVAAPTSGLLLAAQGSWAWAGIPTSTSASFSPIIASISGGSAGAAMQGAPSSLNGFTTADGNQTFLTGQSFPVGTLTKVAMAWAGSSQNGAKDGVLGSAKTYTTPVFDTTVRLNASGVGTGFNALVFSVTFNTVTPANVQTATV